MKTIEVKSPVGSLYVSEEAGAIVRISRIPIEVSESSELLERCRRQLEEYFDGVRTEFDLPLRLEGTEFQKAVWKAMCRIEYGTCASYQQLAELAGYPRAVRAAGTACGHNPIGIVIPCHRIVRTDGKIGNYAWGTEMKEFLQHLEKKEREKC